MAFSIQQDVRVKPYYAPQQIMHFYNTHPQNAGGICDLLLKEHDKSNEMSSPRFS